MTRTILNALSPIFVILALCATGISAQVMAQSPGPRYRADVPKSILTPNKVTTGLLGNLEFFDGMPSKATVEKTYDFLDVSRGVEAFLSGMPATSVYAALEGMKAAGMKPGDLGMMEKLLDAQSLFLTPNTTTVYRML